MLEFLISQIIESRTFAKRLISELPQELWYEIPANTDSNFAWQIGHLLLAQNFHAITVITGRNEHVNRLVPVVQYVKHFNGMGALHRSVEKSLVTPSVLLEQLEAVHEICISNLQKLDETILGQPLEPIPFKHPVANTKYEALSWSFKHEMWHCAEMEAIKQTLGYPTKWM